MQSLGSFLTACCWEIRGKSWLKWQVFLSSHSPSIQPGCKAQLAATAPGLSCRHFWLQITFLFTQFSSTCSYQCFGEASGKTEDSRSWVFYHWRWSIQAVLSISSLCPHTSYSPTHFQMLQLLFPHCSTTCSPNYFSPLTSLTWCQTKEDTWTLPSSLFIPSCSEFQLLPCMVPGVKVFALPPNPVCPAWELPTRYTKHTFQAP